MKHVYGLPVLDGRFIDPTNNTSTPSNTTNYTTAITSYAEQLYHLCSISTYKST